MKKQLCKKSLWRSALSVFVIGIIILLATNCDNNFSIDSLFNELFGYIEGDTKYLGNGIYKEWKRYGGDHEGEGFSKSIVGFRDDFGNWHGPITRIDTVCEILPSRTRIRRWSTNYVHGEIHGKKIYFDEDGNVTSTECYNMGNEVKCEKSAYFETASISAFQILSDKYSDLLYSFNFSGFDDIYIEAYCDTLETLLTGLTFDDEAFDDSYDEVIEILEDTPYDSIIDANLFLTNLNGLDIIKKSEFRMAAIDRYRSDGSSMYNILQTTYPDYILDLKEGDATDEDIEAFCDDLDDTLTSYGPLDPEDIWFIDSVESYMYRAVFNIYAADDSASGSLKSVIGSISPGLIMHYKRLYDEVDLAPNSQLLKLSSAEVAEVVIYYLFIDLFYEGDLIRKAVFEAYLKNKGVILIPTVTTVFSESNSATSATLEGYVLESGGADVTDRGIAWAEHHNPIIDDNSESSGTGNGSFAIMLFALTEGTTYYARTFAINSAGTAYGNCVSFVAGEITDPVNGLHENQPNNQKLTIYPNPASAVTTLSFVLESWENISLIMVDMKGRVIYDHDLGILSPGENQVQLDLSVFQNGLYTCRFRNNGTTIAAQNLVITH